MQAAALAQARERGKAARIEGGGEGIGTHAVGNEDDDGHQR